MSDDTDLQAELHNQLAPEVVSALMTPMTEFGGERSDVMVLIETVVAACVLHMCGGDMALTKKILDCLREGAERRCEELRLMNEVAGNA